MNDRIKFDPARVVALADAFAAPRLAGSPGEAEALGRMAVELAGSGMEVERPSRRRRVLSTALETATGSIFSLPILILFVLATSSLRGGWHAAWITCDVVALILAALSMRPLPGWVKVDEEVPTVEARTGQGPSVAIVARAATPPRTLSGPSRWATFGLSIGVLGAFQAATLFPLQGWAAPIRQPMIWAIVLALVALLCRIKPNRGGPGPGDNRLGLAFLVELARTWPNSARNRVAVRFIVQGGPLRSTLLDPSDPSLTIEIVDPGLGPTLLLDGTRADLVLDAARDLWVPHARPDRPNGRDFLAASVVIAGDPTADGSPDPAAIGRAAQLVIEVALRWARISADRS